MNRPLLALLALVAASRCATAVNGPYEMIPVGSEPAGAEIIVNCGDMPRDGGITPTKVMVLRAAKDCRLTVMKSGYQQQEVVFQRQRSRVAAGNRVPGVAVGIVGAVIVAVASYDADLTALVYEGGAAATTGAGNAVDRRSGGAYKQVPGEVFVTLEPKQREPVPDDQPGR
jgi:hypothetical protein